VSGGAGADDFRNFPEFLPVRAGDCNSKAWSYDAVAPRRNPTMTATDPRRDDRRAAAARVADAAGQVWRHSNPAELYRWVCRRNDLLRTIADGADRCDGTTPR
jgi:hypothetical protein